MLDRTELESPEEDIFSCVEEISDDIFNQVSIAGPDVRADVSVVNGQASNFGMLGEILQAAGSALRTFGSGEASNTQERPDFVVLLGESDKARYILAPYSSRTDTANARNDSNHEYCGAQLKAQQSSEIRYPHLPTGAKHLESPPGQDSEEETMARIQALMEEQAQEHSNEVLPATYDTDGAKDEPLPKRTLPKLNQIEEEQYEEGYRISFHGSNLVILALSLLPTALVYLSNHDTLLLFVISAFTAFAAAYTVRSMAKPFA